MEGEMERRRSCCEDLLFKRRALVVSRGRNLSNSYATT
ncbi:hypothetical protein CIB84_012782 [Bambusicola thoracicus]|uniref:Uncharacterized protein n=1 Tax=Bambusicola thoracicus TaxID=9083 RepID=A0A2P4SH79_BAMTH|nr:hypothetical protein CIB84_012782 [Bambusicola thoracicus]